MSAIKAGDLVMVVRPTLCCGDTGNIGTVYPVAEVVKEISACIACGEETAQWMAWGDEYGGAAVSRVIRIDPLPEPEHTETEREVTV